MSLSETDRMIESFLDASGVTDPLVLRVREPGSKLDDVRILRLPFAVVGRDPRSDLVLEDKLVSRRHVYLQVIDGEICWTDLDSRYGTSSNGQVQKTGWMERGTVLRVGHHELQRVFAHDPGDAEASRVARPRVSPFVARSQGERPLPEIVLEFLNGPSRGTRWPMNRVMSLVGAAEGNKFRLADPSVSAFHCSLVRTSAGLWVVDLLGQDGVAVNDAPVRHALLSDGDVLRIGRYRIAIRSRLAGAGLPTLALPLAGPPQLAPAVADRRGAARQASPAETPSTVGGSVVRAEAGRPSIGGGLPGLSPSEPTTQLGWLSPAMSNPLLLDRSELGESVLVPLVNQFGMMQQQMMDQFQQAISMLVQMFGSLHQDQMKVIREELDQLRVLTEELQTLKHDLAARSQTQPGVVVPPQPVAAAGHDGGRILEGLKERVESLHAAASRVQRPPSAAAQVPPVEPGSDRLSEARRPVQTPAAASKAAEERAKRPAEVPRAHKSSMGPDPETDRDVIVWLHQRMMTLQRERETRWQKILKLLPGLS